MIKMINNSKLSNTELDRLEEDILENIVFLYEDRSEEQFIKINELQKILTNHLGKQVSLKIK